MRPEYALVVVVCIANNRGEEPFVRLWDIALLLGEVGADALLVVLVCLLLGLLEDELCDVAVEVFV